MWILKLCWSCFVTISQFHCLVLFLFLQNQLQAWFVFFPHLLTNLPRWQLGWSLPCLPGKITLGFLVATPSKLTLLSLVLLKISSKEDSGNVIPVSGDMKGSLFRDLLRTHFPLLTSPLSSSPSNPVSGRPNAAWRWRSPLATCEG